MQCVKHSYQYELALAGVELKINGPRFIETEQLDIYHPGRTADCFAVELLHNVEILTWRGKENYKLSMQTLNTHGEKLKCVCGVKTLNLFGIMWGISVENADFDILLNEKTIFKY